MHIEPGVVTGAKLVLGYVTAAGTLGHAAKQALTMAQKDGIVPVAVRSVVTTALAFSFFQILPHHPVGVSEVHLIFGSTLFLMFGAAPTAIGLALGLLIQGLFFAPTDLPQYGMNVTSLLAPLMAIGFLARKIIPANVAYKDVTYGQAFALSTVYQGGIVSWVAFWAFYGYGFTAESLTQIATFGGAYMLVVVVEPVLDLAVLAAAKSLHGLKDSPLFTARLYHAREN